MLENFLVTSSKSYLSDSICLVYISRYSYICSSISTPTNSALSSFSSIIRCKILVFQFIPLIPMRQFFYMQAPSPCPISSLKPLRAPKQNFTRSWCKMGFIESLFNVSFCNLLCLLQAQKGQKSDVSFLQKMEKQGITDHPLVWIGLINPIPAWNDVKCRDRAIMALYWFEPILKHEKMF